MEPIRFNQETDLAPIPFSEKLCEKAAALKQAGLIWKPHVGCFVWDREGVIEATSPFPHRIYFILSMPRFMQIFKTIEHMVEKLVWLPTWNQARLLCENRGVGPEELMERMGVRSQVGVENELIQLYDIICTVLDRHSRKAPD